VTVATKANHSLEEIPNGIWTLGFVSMLMGVPSEMIHPLLPVYLVTVQGTSMDTVGVIKGIAEATASTTKIFSGALWDVAGPRGIFFAGTWFAFLALAGLPGVRGQSRRMVMA
jgi:hypothetical protein